MKELVLCDHQVTNALMTARARLTYSDLPEEAVMDVVVVGESDF